MTEASLDNSTTRVLRLRLKDKHASELEQLAREVNFVWNYSQELALKVFERELRFMSAFDIARYTRGATKAGLALHSQSVQAVSEEYVLRRRQFKKVKLRWRVSRGPRRSLGWVPFKASAVRYRSGQLFISGVSKPLSLWDSYGLADYELGSGTISEDARGRWYINVTVKVQRAARSARTVAVGIDLGLKEFAALSDGRQVAAHRFYRDLEPALALAQRARKKQRARALHAKITNRRQDALHKLSSQLVAECGAIFVGNVNASGLAQTRMAKSVLDAGWSTFRTMLQYKCDDAGVWFEEVNEAYSTQECSACHARSGPAGLAGLAVRRWTCSVCGTEHDRDTNAAENIKQRGLIALEKEFCTVAEAKADEAVVNKAPHPKQVSGAEVGHHLPAQGILVL
jgi:IS605 OrfB family transposase